jgi:hypothetical protein
MNSSVTNTIEMIYKFYEIIKDNYIDDNFIKSFKYLIEPLTHNAKQLQERLNLLDDVKQIKVKEKLLLGFQTIELISRFSKAFDLLYDTLSKSDTFNQSRFKSSMPANKKEEIQSFTHMILASLKAHNINEYDFLHHFNMSLPNDENTLDELNKLYEKYPATSLYVLLIEQFLNGKLHDKVLQTLVKHKIKFLNTDAPKNNIKPFIQPLVSKFGFVTTNEKGNPAECKHNHIIIRNLTRNPVIFDTTFMKPDFDKKDEFSGITGQLIKKTTTISFQKPAKKLFFTKIDVVNTRSELWSVFETLDDVNYRYLVPWSKKSNVFPKEYVTPLLMYIESPNNTIHETVLKNSLLEKDIVDKIYMRPIPIERLTDEVKTQLDLPKIRYALATVLKEYKGDVKILLKEIEKIAQPLFTNSKFNISEFKVTFYRELKSLERAYLKVQPGTDYLEIMNTILHEKNNIFRTIVFKQLLFHNAAIS